jgi:hypothetical protein
MRQKCGTVGVQPARHEATSNAAHADSWTSGSNDFSTEPEREPLAQADVVGYAGSLVAEEILRGGQPLCRVTRSVGTGF